MNPSGWRIAGAVLFVILCLVLAGTMAACNTVTPEPKIVTHEVKVPVAVKCSADPGPRPTFADTPEAIRAAKDVFERVKLILAGREQRDAWIGKVEAANGGCR